MSALVGIRLKIPDNAAYTALVALQRLGIDVARVERTDVREADDIRDFNPNKHVLAEIPQDGPRPGETWISPIAAGGRRARRIVAWRLLREDRTPVDAAIVRDAVEKLLCNPAIERARIG